MVRPSSHKNLHHISIGSYLELTVEHTHTHAFNGPLSGTTQVGRYQKGKTSLDFTEATDSEWQWHQLDHMQVYISLQADNHASTPPLSFLQAGCPSCGPTNSVKALKAELWLTNCKLKSFSPLYLHDLILKTDDLYSVCLKRYAISVIKNSFKLTEE